MHPCSIPPINLPLGTKFVWAVPRHTSLATFLDRFRSGLCELPPSAVAAEGLLHETFSENECNIGMQVSCHGNRWHFRSTRMAVLGCRNLKRMGSVLDSVVPEKLSTKERLACSLKACQKEQPRLQYDHIPLAKLLGR